MESLIHHFKLVTEGFRVDPGEIYYAIESPRGELGCFVLADGSSKPSRVHFRDPSFVNLQAFSDMALDTYVADMICQPRHARPDPRRGRPMSPVDGAGDQQPQPAGRPRGDRGPGPAATPRRSPSCTKSTARRSCGERIEQLMSRYPDRHSASIPALWAVQERYGWCTPEGIRQAAAVMRVTPAYLESVASFYDLLHTEPVGSHRIEVCTNISCWMRGGDELLDAFQAAAEGEDGLLRHRLRVPRRLRHRPDGLDRPALLRPARGGRGRRSRSSQLRAGDEVLPEKALEKRPLAGDTPSPGGVAPQGGRCLTRARPASCSSTPRTRRCARSRATSGWSAATRRWRRPTATMEQDEVLKELEDSGLRGPRRRRLLDGQKGLLPAARRNGRSTSAATPTSPSRAPSRTAS